MGIVMDLSILNNSSVETAQYAVVKSHSLIKFKVLPRLSTYVRSLQ